jgi:Toprim domain
VLRFHPAHWWRRGAAGEPIQAPALLALYRDIRTNAPRAIWRRALTPDGCSLGPPRFRGSKAGCAIKLTADEDVAEGLHVGEGVETMLAAMMLGFAPAWALGDAGGVERFPVLAGIDVLTVIVDNDANAVGQKAAAICYDCWRAAGAKCGASSLTRSTPT